MTGSTHKTGVQQKNRGSEPYGGSFPAQPVTPVTAPPMPQIHPDCLTEVHTLVSAARDALADAGMAHDARACWECLQAWQPKAPAVSQAQVRAAHERLVAASSVQPGLLDPPASAA